MVVPDLRRSGIYVIRSIVDGKVYVGSAQRIGNRWNLHRAQIAEGIHHNRLLQRAWAKHGASNFAFEVIEMVDDLDSLLTREQFWIDTLSACDRQKGYNLAPTAGSNRGIKLTEEQLQAMRNRPPIPRPPEVRAKISASMKGRRKPPEFSLALSNRVWTEEARANASKAAKQREPRKRGFKLGPRPPEVKAKLSAAGKRYFQSEEGQRSERKRVAGKRAPIRDARQIKLL